MALYKDGAVTVGPWLVIWVVLHAVEMQRVLVFCKISCMVSKILNGKAEEDTLTYVEVNWIESINVFLQVEQIIALE